MCLGCKMRERMMRRTHQRLAKLEAEFDRARRDLHDLVVDTAGPFAEPPPPIEPPGTQLKLAV